MNNSRANTNTPPATYGTFLDNLTEVDQVSLVPEEKRQIQLGGGNRIAYKNFVDEIMDQFIGTIHQFAYDGGVPAGYLLCNGGEYLKSDYPKLYGKIGDVFGTGDYPAPSDTDHFRVPDLQDQFIRNTDGVKAVGKQYTDTMRKITGNFNNGTTRLASNSSGAFQIQDKSTFIYTTESGSQNYFSSILIDSSKGIEGQEGQVSPNVGSETAPKHTILVFAIKAK